MENLVTALVARRYYLDGQTKSQIADEFGVSRFKVARLLDSALRDGVVRIEIDVPPEVDLTLGSKLERRFGLRQALVVRTEDEPAAMRRQLGRTCASLLVQRLSDADVLGLSWGRTLLALTDVVPSLPRAGVVQMVGSVPTADLAVNSLELLRRMGAATGGAVHPLHVPMILDSPATAAALRAVDYVAATLRRIPEITCALVGIGDWHPEGSSLRAALPRPLVAELDRMGAVADVCSTVVNADGEIIGTDTVAPRCIAVTTPELRGIPDVIAVAGGLDKVEAIAAAARAGLVHRLITDAGAATELLARA